MDEGKIIRKIKKRDEQGLIQFIEKYGNVIKGIIVNTIPQYNYLWDEIMNDTLMDIWKNINYYDSSRSSFK